MDLPANIIIGNIISLIGGFFLILSMWVNDEKKAYKHQFINAFILMISSVFFLSWTGVVTMAIAATRNAMVYKDKLTFKWVVVFIAVSVILGLMVNTLGFIGLLPIIAIVQLSLSNYYLKTIKSIKISFIVNSGIYVVYFLMIYDFSSAVIEGFTTLIGLVALLRLLIKSSENN